MKDTKRHSTKYPGVSYRLVERIGGAGTEKMFYVRFKKDGELYEEKAGRQYADNMNPAKAARIRADRIEGRRKSRKELREEAAARDKPWTVDRLASAYFESLEANPAKSRKALSTDRNRYDNFIKLKLSRKEPKELQPLDIERLRRELQKTKCTLKGKPETTRTLSPATIRATLTVLGRIINYGANSGLCAALPFKIKKPRDSGVTIEDVNEDQLKRLLAAIAADTNADARGIMLIALYSGMRRGELFKLKWQDVDFDRGFIRIVGPKGGQDQTIPLNAAARKVLESHPRISEYVFPGEDGGQRVTIQKALRRIREAAGLPKTFRPLHGLRHAFASRLASSGAVDMYTLQKLLTHKSPVMTQRYAHLRDESLRKASERAGTLVDEAVNGKEGATKSAGSI
jgi:integrase